MEGIEDIDKAISELDKKMEGLNIARICFHEGDKSLLMSMLIRIKNKYHYPIHRHIWKDESYTILEGSCDFIEYDENGKELKKIRLDKGGYYFNKRRLFHTLVPKSDIVTYIEHTTGPFDGRKLEYIGKIQAN